MCIYIRYAHNANDLVMTKIGIYMLCMHVLMRDKKEGRKKQARSNKQQLGKATRTPKAVTFPKKNELPRSQSSIEPSWMELGTVSTRFPG